MHQKDAFSPSIRDSIVCSCALRPAASASSLSIRSLGLSEAEEGLTGDDRPVEPCVLSELAAKSACMSGGWIALLKFERRVKDDFARLAEPCDSVTSLRCAMACRTYS